MIDNTTYRSSGNTPYKQQSLYSLLSQNMAIVNAIWDRWKLDTSKRVYQYFDLHGGRGYDDKGHPGSPLIFHQVAAEQDTRYNALVFERDIESYAELCRHAKNTQLDILNEDHNALIKMLEGKQYEWQFGIAYSDPSNADPAFEVLAAIARAYPQMEIAINIAAASYKRM